MLHAGPDAVRSTDGEHAVKLWSLPGGGIGRVRAAAARTREDSTRGFKSRRGGLRWPIKLGYRGQTTPKSRYVDLIERRNVRARPTLPTPEVNRALNIATSLVD